MASEAITRNDLTAILNEVLPPTASEYRKLLWTNPNPSSSFAAQTVSTDLSDYDEVEVICKPYSADASYFTSRVKVGNRGMLYSQTGYGSPVRIYGTQRNFTPTSTGVAFGDGLDFSASVSNAYCVPYQIYGISYERVAPPQIDGWDYVTSVTGGNTVTFTDLATQGYSEVYVNDSSGFGGGYSPVVALPTALVWGGFYGGVNGLLHGVDITTTSIKGRYGITDSTNYLSTMTFYLYAR